MDHQDPQKRSPPYRRRLCRRGRLLFKEHRETGKRRRQSYITEVKKLSDYSDSVKDSVNDANVYIFDSGVPGGTAVLIGGTHPE
jgi:hypothetical protein